MALLLAPAAAAALARAAHPLLARSSLAAARVRLSGVAPSDDDAFRLNLLSCTAEELQTVLKSWKQPKFRAKQIHDWIYNKGVADFEEMANLPVALRQKLSEHARVGSMEVSQEQVSRDGTRKRLWRLHDGRLIESVLMPYDTNRRTACISSQVGCAMGCTFCATGQMGYTRQLTSDEIFEQAARFAMELKLRDERLSNVVFMGMGEPFRNFDAVIDAAKRIRSDLGIGSRHITISTVGLVPEIRRFADLCADESLEISLAISLHQSTDEARGAIMPVNRKYNLQQLIDACHYYVETSRRRLTFEWALIEGENDSVEEARRLGKLLRGLKCHVNLIPLNPTKGFGGAPSRNSQAFVAELGKCGIPATVRVRRGIDIDAGCGQLAEEASKEVARDRLEKKIEQKMAKVA